MLNFIKYFKSKPVVIVKPFVVEEFNEWFKQEYGAGIFLRIDKLSPSMVETYLKTINQSTIHYNIVACRSQIIYNWKNLNE